MKLNYDFNGPREGSAYMCDQCGTTMNGYLYSGFDPQKIQVHFCGPSCKSKYAETSTESKNIEKFKRLLK